MSINSLRYWVFTSGEQGIHGLDWGIKHASEYFSDRQKLDSEYRRVLKDFDLLPSLERPDNEVGLILLPWDKSDFIAGFIFSGTDHGGRPNTSSVICLIPSEVIGRMSANEVLKAIWENNNIFDISRINSLSRPDTLIFDVNKLDSDSAPAFKGVESWPNRNNGWLYVDGHLRELRHFLGTEDKEVKPHTKRKMIPALLFFVVILTFGTCYIILSSKPAEDVKESPNDNNTIYHDIKDDNVSNEPNNQVQQNIIVVNKTTSGEDRAGKIEELRKNIISLLTNAEITEITQNSFTVRARDWKEKEKSFDVYCKSIAKLQDEHRTKTDKIEEISKFPKLIKFQLSTPISQDVDVKDIDKIDKLVTKFLEQFKEEK